MGVYGRGRGGGRGTIPFLLNRKIHFRLLSTSNFINKFCAGKKIIGGFDGKEHQWLFVKT
jgi:hypothetical protein